MDITYNEFEILTCVEKEKKKLSQRELSKLTDLSLGTVNKVVIDLQNRGLLDENNLISEDGLHLLEPYRVKGLSF